MCSSLSWPLMVWGPLATSANALCAVRVSACCLELLTNVNESPVVLDPLHCTALGILFLFLLCYLGCLSSHLTSTRQGSVHLTCKADRLTQVKQAITSKLCQLASIDPTRASRRLTHGGSSSWRQKYPLQKGNLRCLAVLTYTFGLRRLISKPGDCCLTSEKGNKRLLHVRELVICMERKVWRQAGLLCAIRLAFNVL